MSASHLKFNNILVDWSVRNITGTLFCKIFANAKVPACMHCQSTQHLSNFCVMTHKAEKFQIEKKVGLYSRKRQYYAGIEGNNFNSARQCQLSKCNNAHLCSDCNGELSKQNCTLAKKKTWNIK